MSLPFGVWAEMSKLFVMPNTHVGKVVIVVTVTVADRFKICDSNK
jgi:hypothetical protein